MYEETEVVIGRLLEREQAEWFLEARRAYLEADFEKALQFDKKLLAWAAERGHGMGKILGHRFVGLCLYRKESLEESERHLRAALALAESTGVLPQAFLCANHLGATLRRQGRLYEAYQTFRDYLERTTLPTYAHERARLYGNLGAILDVLGQRAAADDCYARMEELCELLGNPDRLANARGLAARAAYYRNDRTTALRKYEEERSLAVQSKNTARHIAATIHMAMLHAKQGQFDKATALCEEALCKAEELQHPGRLIDAWECRGEVNRRQGKLATAYASLHAALQRLACISDHAEKRANIFKGLALLCRSAGLHGEALYYLAQVAQIRWQLFEPLRADEWVRQRAQDKLRELKELARELAQESRTVAREQHERVSIKKLLCQILDRPEMTDSELEAELDGALPADLWKWQYRQRDEAQRLWSERLLPGTFNELCPESRSDLIRAEVSYSATVCDLPRFAHLLAVVVERELRMRIVEPAASVVFSDVGQDERWVPNGLGSILHLLQAAREGRRLRNRNEESLRQHLTLALAPHSVVVDKILRLQGPLCRADNRTETFTLRELRNAVAHGDDGHRFPNLDRLTVDAVKRALILEDDPPLLAQIARFRLEPGTPRSGRPT